MGYERRRPARLLFLHNDFQRHSARKRAERTANTLTPGRGAFDGDEIDRAARTLVVENTDRQPPGSPSEGVEIGSAFVEQWAVGVIIVTVDNVEVAEAFRISLGIALPQQRLHALKIKGSSGIDARMDIEAMGIDVKQPQPIEPIDVGLWHANRLSSIGSQSGIAALRQPRRHWRTITERIEHQGNATD